MKRIICALLLLALVLSLAACSPREVISAEEFTARMTEAGYTVHDFSDFMDDTDFGIEAFLVADAEVFEVEFMVFETAESARSMYNQIRQEMDESRGRTASTRETNVANFNRFSMTTDGRFEAVTRVENTVLAVGTDAEFRDDVNAIFDLMGY